MGGGVGWGSVPPPEICNRAECAGNEESMTIEKRLAEAQKLIDEVKAELAAKAKPARNWPEKIELGHAFRHISTNAVYIAMYRESNRNEFDLRQVTEGLSGKIGNFWNSGNGFGESTPNEWEYLGHARDVLTIRAEKAEAHEPTGAELVGKVCEFSDDGETWVGRELCARFDLSDAEMRFRSETMIGKTGCGQMWFKFARLAR